MMKKVYKRVANVGYKTVDNEFPYTNSKITEIAKKIDAQIFTGGPVNSFEEAGKLQLITLLKCGLIPSSKVLDVGCGALRGGYWMIKFLNKDCFFGIEPNETMLQIGINEFFTAEELNEKNPRFDHNDQFDLTCFDTQFDFVHARSIWTHTSTQQIDAFLDSFKKVAHPDSLLLTSYLRINLLKKEYKGDDWIGISHESDEKGIARYSFKTIKKICDKHGLSCKELPFDVYNSQIWIAIKP